jgi:hypothetical protein
MDSPTAMRGVRRQRGDLVKRALVIVADVVLLPVLAGGWRPLREWKLLRRFESGDPVAEDREALACNDRRLLAGDYGWVSVHQA